MFEEIKSEPAYSEVREATEWIKIVEVDLPKQKKLLSSRLHAGEVEVILHAKDTKADLVILDDKLARKTARYMELTITGTLGVIVKAKEKGYIHSVRPVMDKLIHNGLYVSPEIQEMVLRSVNEF